MRIAHEYTIPVDLVGYVDGRLDGGDVDVAIDMSAHAAEIVEVDVEVDVEAPPTAVRRRRRWRNGGDQLHGGGAGQNKQQAEDGVVPGHGYLAILCGSTTSM